MHISTSFLAAVLVFSTVGIFAQAKQERDHRLPVEMVPLETVPDLFTKSDIVVIGLVDYVSEEVIRDDAGNNSTPGAKLAHDLRKLRDLGDAPIPGYTDERKYSDKISVYCATSNKEEQAKANEMHQNAAKAIYAKLGERPYVLSNPVIFLLYKGKLVRCYGAYHEAERDGIKLQRLVKSLLAPDWNKNPTHPEIIMMNTLALRAEKGNEQAAAYLQQEFLTRDPNQSFYDAYSYFWTEAQVRSGAVDSYWASMVFDIVFTVSKEAGYYDSAMQVVSNVTSNMEASGRFGRLAEVMAEWEKGQKLAGNRMDIRSYKDLGSAIECLPEIRHRDMPVTLPSPVRVEAGSNSSGFHVNAAGAFQRHASLLHASGRWREAMEYTVWLRDWATNDKTNQPIGEYATCWYGATSTLIDNLQFMGFREEALALVEEGMAAPHGQTYYGRWKILLAADLLDALLSIDKPDPDTLKKFPELVEKAMNNSHITRGGANGVRTKYARALIKMGKISEGEDLLDKVVADGSLEASIERLSHWIRSGRVDGVEEELQSLLKLSRKYGQKLGEYGLYQEYADFLEKTGRLNEALLMRREVIRLASIFDLTTHLPLEKSKLAVLLARLGDPLEADTESAQVTELIKAGKFPKWIIDEITANLNRIGTIRVETPADTVDREAVDLQPQKSMVIPLVDAPWVTYMTLTNPGKMKKTGRLVIQGQDVKVSQDNEREDIVIHLLGTRNNTKPTEFACTVQPGTFRLIQIKADKETKAEGEIHVEWKNSNFTSQASVNLEAAESEVRGAIIQAGNYRENPFYGISMYLQYVSKGTDTTSPPLRFISSQPARIEVYGIDEKPLAIDAKGNGSLLNSGDELFVTSDGKGNLVLPIEKNQAAMNLRVYPEKGIPEEGITVTVEVLVDGTWQSHSTNQITK